MNGGTMYIRTALAASTLALILMVIPVSADESDALYKGKVVITNAGTEVEGGTTVLLELNTGAWQGAGILDASFNNAWFESAAGASMAFMPDPSDGTDPQEWYFFHPWDLAAGDSLAYLYMGGPDMTPPLYYMPGATGMTMADTDGMELGDTFAIEQKGYIDTSYAASKQLVYKSGAFQTYIPSEGVVASVVGALTTVRPTTYTDVTGFWLNEVNAYDNNTTTHAQCGMADKWCEWYRAATVTNAISVYATNRAFDIEYYDGAIWHSLGTNVAPFDGWQSISIGSYQSVEGVRVCKNITQDGSVYLKELAWDAVDCAVAASVASGSHTIRTEADGTDLELYVDGVLEDSMALGAATVPDNANAWSFLTNGAMPYMDYHKVWVGAALVQHIEWEDDTTFTDLSGTGNDVTPSFPTGSSDADVSAALASMEPLDPAAAPAVGGDEAGGLAGGLPTEPDNMYDELAVDHLPGAAVVNALLDAGEIPRALFWFLAVFLGIIIACLFMYRLSHSLFAMSLVAGAGLLFASRIGIVPFWVTVPVILVAAAVLIKEKMSPL